MDLSFLNEYLVLVVVGICLCVGYVLKHYAKLDKWIPLMMLVLGAVLNLWVNGWAFTPVVLLGGMLSGLASTGLHQVFKQLISVKEA